MSEWVGAASGGRGLSGWGLFLVGEVCFWWEGSATTLFSRIQPHSFTGGEAQSRSAKPLELLQKERSTFLMKEQVCSGGWSSCVMLVRRNGLDSTESTEPSHSGVELLLQSETSFVAPAPHAVSCQKVCDPAGGSWDRMGQSPSGGEMTGAGLLSAGASSQARLVLVVEDLLCS